MNRKPEIKRRRSLERIICREQGIKPLPRAEWPSEMVDGLAMARSQRGLVGFVGYDRDGFVKLVVYDPLQSKQSFKQ